MNQPHYGGVVIEERQPEDFVVGANSPIKLEPLLTSGYWVPFMGRGELQQILLKDGSRKETNGCTNFTSTHHVLAPRIKLMLDSNILQKDYPAAFQFGLKNKYFWQENGIWHVDLSERYNFIKSKTNPNEGNSGRAVCEAHRIHGIVPGSVLPNDGCASLEEFMTSTPQADALGKESLEYFNISWQEVPKEATDAWIVQAPIMWFIPIGEGYSSLDPIPAATGPVQHAVGKVAASDPQKHIYDSYQPFLKNLVPEYPTPYAFQLIIKPKPVTPPPGVPAPKPYVFTRDMVYGERSQDVLHLQARLNVPQTGIYDDTTRARVFSYQILSLNWTVYGEVVRSLVGRRVGPATRAVLNAKK